MDIVIITILAMGFVIQVFLIIVLYHMLFKKIESINDDISYLVLSESDYDFKEDFEDLYRDLGLLRDHISEYKNLSMKDMLRMSTCDFLMSHDAKLKGIYFKLLATELELKKED